MPHPPVVQRRVEKHWSKNKPGPSLKEYKLKRLSVVRRGKPAQKEGGNTKAAGSKCSVLSQRTACQPKGSIQKDGAIEARIHVEDLQFFVQTTISLSMQ